MPNQADCAASCEYLVNNRFGACVFMVSIRICAAFDRSPFFPDAEGLPNLFETPRAFCRFLFGFRPDERRFRRVRRYRFVIRFVRCGYRKFHRRHRCGRQAFGCKKALAHAGTDGASRGAQPPRRDSLNRSEVSRNQSLHRLRHLRRLLNRYRYRVPPHRRASWNRPRLPRHRLAALTHGGTGGFVIV